MRYATLSAVILVLGATTMSAFELPNLQPFFSALPLALSDYIPTALQNATDTEYETHDILKRQSSNTCPSDFNNCGSLGASGLCCAPHAICSADAAGHVACCPSGAACSGTITGVITAGTVNSDGSLVSATGASTTGTGGAVIAGTSTPSAGLVMASTATTTTISSNNGNAGTGSAFVVDGSSVVATPAAAIRAAQIPAIARAAVQIMDVFAV